MKRILISALTACSLVSARADLFHYTVTFSDVGEANPSAGTGFATVDYDSTFHTLSLSANFSGLTGDTTASHIHAPTTLAGTGNAGVATTTPTFASFPLGVKSGTFANVLNLTLASSWNPSFVGVDTLAFAESRLAAAMADGKAYWNIHSTYSAGGEVRGFLTQVPEPGTLALAGLAAVGMVLRTRNKRLAGKA